MAATTRKKAPARWAVLLVSGLASAGFLWGIVNAPGSAGANSTAADSSTALAPTPTATQQLVRRRGERGGDDGISSLILPSSPGSVSVPQSQPSQSTQPLVSTGRFRTRGS